MSKVVVERSVLRIIVGAFGVVLSTLSVVRSAAR